MRVVKFVVDHMLGKLAKYLRFMGYDTYYPTGRMSDDEIMEIARKEGRILLTRDKELAKRSGGIYIESENYEEQLKFVINRFHLNTDSLLSRCSICNVPLVKVDKREIKDKVPEYVYEHQDDFYMCPKCGRIYWYGSHTERIEKKIRELMGEEDED